MPGRVLLGGAGLGLMAYAAYGLVTDVGTEPVRQVAFLLGLVIAHDFVLIPAAIAVGLVAVRIVPWWARAATQGALITTLALTVVSIPLLVKGRGFADNPSLLPLDYRRGLLVAIGVTWVVAAAVAVWRRQRARRRP
jgi:hypothetical protein